LPAGSIMELITVRNNIKEVKKRSFPGLTLTFPLVQDYPYAGLEGFDVICNESDLCGILNEICKVISDSQIRTQRQDAMLLHQ